jgi:hypothetical protein
MGQSRIARARDEISTYLATEASLYGLRSSHAALVSIAMGGVGGCLDPDAKMARHIDRNGHDMARIAVVRGVVMGLPASHRDVLLVAFAPVVWRTRIDAACGRGAGTLAERHYGDELGLVWAQHGPACTKWGQGTREARRKAAAKRVMEALESYIAARRATPSERGRERERLARAHQRPVTVRGRFSLVMELA